jgi:hypothetical protein
MESLERRFEGGGKLNHPKKGKVKRTLLVVPRHAKDSGERATNENERKLG